MRHPDSLTHPEVLRSRLAGSLYGLLVGDALGCPVEGWTHERIRAFFGELRTMETATERWRPAGLHSDDGQQALALTDGILESPDRPEYGFGRIVCELGKGGGKGAGYHRGTGQSFRATLRALLAGAEPWEAAQPTCGNGVAMMIAPVAWFWRDEPDALARHAIAVARVKQSDVRGIAAAAAVAFLAEHGLRHGSFRDLPHDGLLGQVADVERRTAEALETGEHVDTFSIAFGEMLADLNLPAARALDRIAERASGSAGRRCHPGSGYALASVLTACRIALTSRSFEDAVVEAVNTGGDTDTLGAMVGALCGAAYGLDSIPEEWYAALVARDRLDDRVDAMLRRDVPWRPERSLLSLEAEWTEWMESVRQDSRSRIPP